MLERDGNGSGDAACQTGGRWLIRQGSCAQDDGACRSGEGVFPSKWRKQMRIVCVRAPTLSALSKAGDGLDGPGYDRVCRCVYPTRTARVGDDAQKCPGVPRRPSQSACDNSVSVVQSRLALRDRRQAGGRWYATRWEEAFGRSGRAAGSRYADQPSKLASHLISLGRQEGEQSNSPGSTRQGQREEWDAVHAP